MKSKYPEIPTSRYLELCSLIKKTLGLYFPPKKKDELFKGILEFYSDIGVKNLDECIEHILATQDSQKMCEKLASHLTVGETFFFRHFSQFETISKKLLTNLTLEKKKKSDNICLRFWSSACCTGEEPYSIAMMLEDMRYNFSDWDIHITGSDLNPIYLKKAQIGKYRNWSFRDEGTAITDKYFETDNNGTHLLTPKIKSKVHFLYHNLVTDKYPAMFNGTNGLDFIFCRNALIYFDQPMIHKIAKKFYNCLLDNGWLIVSPAEVSVISSLGIFEPVKFGNVFLFRKKTGTKVKPDLFSFKKPTIIRKTIKPKQSSIEKTPINPKTKIIKTVSKPSQVNDSFKILQATFDSGNYDKIIDSLNKKFIDRKFILPISNETKKELILLIKSYANTGKLKEADYWTETAISLDKLVPEFYYIHATILQELGKEKEMADTLRKVIYLDSKFIPAYFLFGLLLQKQNKKIEAKKYFNTALTLLNTQDSDKIIEEAEGMTVNRLRTIINAML
ncbi:MAG: protein-glutamate O-methyltransferase CheR [bacterium]|nr:protein-glutamate O-methyltransferase CheR [bacterium]